MTKTPQTTYLALQGWGGLLLYPVEILGETPKRYRVRLCDDARLPGGRKKKKGDVVLVPKTAIR